MTGFLSPYWCFGLVTVFGFVIFATAFYLRAHVELESDVAAGMAEVQEDGSITVLRHRSFCEELCNNFRIVKNQFKLRLYQRTLLFFLLIGITRINYMEYMYYFKTEVAGLTQFQFGILSIAGSIFMAIFAIFYSIWLKHFETRTLLTIGLFV